MTTELENEENQPAAEQSDVISDIVSDVFSESASILTPSDLSNSNRYQIKKTPWLNDHFEPIQIGQQIHVVCNACKQKFVSRSLKRLENHFDTCSMTDKTQKPVISGEEGEHSASDMITELWTHCCIENNIAFKAIESDTFKKFT